MKKNRRVVVVALLTLVVLILSVPGISGAAQLPFPPPPPTEGKVSKDPDKSIVIYTRPDEGTRAGAVLISMWSTGISNNYNGTVTIRGATHTYSIVDSVSATVYLQRWNGSIWVDITGRTFSDTDTMYVSDSARISISSGNYYRTRCVHKATLNGSQDGTSSISESIYVN